MTTLYAYANPRVGGGYDAGDPNEELSSPITTSTSAALVATAAILLGAGDRGVQDTDVGAYDDLFAQSATMAGAGIYIHFVNGSGTLSAARAVVAGGGVETYLAYGSGDLAATAATLTATGSAFNIGLIVGSPVDLLATEAALSGLGSVIPESGIWVDVSEASSIWTDL